MAAAESRHERPHKAACSAAASMSAAHAWPRRHVLHDPACDAADPDAISPGLDERALALRAAEEGAARQSPALVMLLAPLLGLLIWAGLIALAF